MIPPYKNELEQRGWTYKGVCSCSVPGYDFLKGEYLLRLRKGSGSWMLIKNKFIERKGKYEELKNIEI